MLEIVGGFFEIEGEPFFVEEGFFKLRADVFLAELFVN